MRQNSITAMRIEPLGITIFLFYRKSAKKPIHFSDFVVQLDESGSIGKRYLRQDSIGTPYCITVDYDSLEDKSVTIQDRDSKKQERVKIEDLKAFLKSNL